MQGGHPDGLRIRLGRVDVSMGGGDSGNESEVSVDDVITLGRRLDGWVAAARETFGTFLALPVAWIQLHPNVASLRRHKLKRVEAGIESILFIQTFRTKWLDLFMQICSFCAEEEFYLLILPLLFWNGLYDLARRLTFVVVTGLFVGNIIKDVFELPRPSSPPVWRPHNQEQLDSTALQDFGFPSTHAMNSVSNSILVAWYFWDSHSPYHNALLCLGAGLWILLLSFSRLYLGAHTGTDVRGGLGLGVLVIGSYLASCDVLDAIVFQTPVSVLFVSLFVGSIVALLLCPQPRPPTPTFHQNAFIAGLLWGLLVGSRIAQGDLRLHEIYPLGVTSSVPWQSATIHFVRNVFGFVFVIIVRAVVKEVMILIMEKGMGIKTKPHVEVVKKRSRAKRGKKVVTKLFTRDVDIIAMAAVKTITYLCTAMAIDYFYPVLWHTYTRGLSSSVQ